MALGLAGTADIGSLVRTVGLAVARLAAATALASELALDALVWAIGSIMARLVAVVAETRVVALIPRLRAVTREVVLSMAAVKQGLVKCQKEGQ
jgi:hypothetical protein